MFSLKKGIVIAAICTCCLLLFGCAAAGGDPTPVPPAGANAAPQQQQQQANVFGAFETVDLNGNTVTDAVFQENTLTMINIWGTFCGPCLVEMPFLGELHAEYASRGFTVIGIVVDVLDQNGNLVDAQVELAKDLVLETGAAYTHLLPSESLNNIKLYSVTSIPESIFVDSQGTIIGQPIIGSKNKEAWAGVIEQYLTETGV